MCDKIGLGTTDDKLENKPITANTPTVFEWFGQLKKDFTGN